MTGGLDGLLGGIDSLFSGMVLAESPCRLFESLSSNVSGEKAFIK